MNKLPIHFAIFLFGAIVGIACFSILAPTKTPDPQPAPSPMPVAAAPAEPSIYRPDGLTWVLVPLPAGEVTVDQSPASVFKLRHFFLARDASRRQMLLALFDEYDALIRSLSPAAPNAGTQTKYIVGVVVHDKIPADLATAKPRAGILAKCFTTEVGHRPAPFSQAEKDDALARMAQPQIDLTIRRDDYFFNRMISLDAITPLPTLSTP